MQVLIPFTFASSGSPDAFEADSGLSAADANDGAETKNILQRPLHRPHQTIGRETTSRYV
jgi:hypothetical protein